MCLLHRTVLRCACAGRKLYETILGQIVYHFQCNSGSFSEYLMRTQPGDFKMALCINLINLLHPAVAYFKTRQYKNQVLH